MTPELAWATGLFEGEGTAVATLSPKRKDGSQRRYPMLAVEMMDEEPVRAFAAVMGGSVTVRTRRDQKTFWRCVIANWRPVLAAYEAMRPLLSERRRRQFTEVFERSEASNRGPSQHPEWRYLNAA